jgi:guanosine-3',5'-bis(diphosphate) 3'-pyrophosphohydrolase
MSTKYNELEQKFFNLVNSNPEVDKEKILLAYKIAYEKHIGQKRLSGEDYIIHPLSVGIILLEMQLDTYSVCAGILHDVFEDTETTEQEITENFNETVTKLIKGVTKISALKNNAKYVSKGYEDLRKFIFSVIDDVRVLIIKLADRLHNMRTLQYQPKTKQIEIARNTLELYAPLASRLGMESIKNELEDLSLYYLDYKAYNYIKTAIASRKIDREKYVDELVEEIKEVLKKENFTDYSIEARSKHFYSIYRKIKYQNKSIDEIYDLIGIRILTSSIKDCYIILGIIHNHFRPIPSRFKDYIAFPKTNLYQSLHTTLIDNNGKHIEIQIRTYEMDTHAKYGIAAHWMYKEKITDEKKIETEIKLFSKLKDWKKGDFADENIIENLKTELLEEQIFVFTPKGDIVELPANATALDFAFAIHTEIGFHCIGAKINGKLVPIRKELKPGDVIEIMTSKSRIPSLDWLEIVKTKKAKTKIKSYFRSIAEANKEQKIKFSPSALQQVTTYLGENLDLKQSEKNLPNSGVYIFGQNNVSYQFASCCNPRTGDKITGYISINKRTVLIHKTSCAFIQNLYNKGSLNQICQVTWNDPFFFYIRKYKIESEDISTKAIFDLVNSIDMSNLKLKELNFSLLENKTVSTLTLESKTEESFTLFENMISQFYQKLKISRLN